MIRFLPRILLLFAGLILFVIGAAILLVPHTFFAESGVRLGHDPSLLSEIRAPGGLLLTSAVVVLLGALRESMRRQALLVATMVYGSFGVSRLLAMAIDGLPSESLLWATGTELLLAAACALSLHFHRPAAATTSTLEQTTPSATRAA